MSTLSPLTTLNMIVEIPKGSNIKYEWNEKCNCLTVDRVINTPVKYFFNYGFIPNTLGPDGDPLDVVLLNSDPIYPLSHVEIKVLGMLETTDEHGQDNKIVAVLSDKIDPQSLSINCMNDICPYTKEQLKYFFIHYKDLDKNKWIEVSEFRDRDIALKHIAEFSLSL